LFTSLWWQNVQRCIDEGLVGGEGFAVDASLIRADVSERTRLYGAAGLPPEAVSRAVEGVLFACPSSKLMGQLAD
jgi:hypothetical protein